MLFLLCFLSCSEYNVDKVFEKNLFDSGYPSVSTDEESIESEEESSTTNVDENEFLTPDTSVSIWRPPTGYEDLPETNDGFNPSVQLNPSDTLTGNVITILMTMSDDWMDE